MEQKLWAVAFILALLKAQLDFFDGRTEGEGTLQTQGFTSIQVNTIYSPIQILENLFSGDITRSPLPWATSGDTEISPPKTMETVYNMRLHGKQMTQSIKLH